MTSTLHMTPQLAARLYRGPQFHLVRTPAENLRLIRQQIRNFKASASASIRYMGCILEAIANLKPQRA